MRYIERVESTLKGGCSVELGPKTILFGPNGGGKSTILQAVELATCGWVSDTEGRDRVKQTHSLARLFPQDGAKYTKCTTSTGEEFSWELEDGAKKGTFKKPVHLKPSSVLWPIQDLQSTLGGDAASVQAWLEKQVFNPSDDDDPLSKLPPTVRPVVSDLIKKKGKTNFLGLAKEARAEAKALRAQATRSEKTIEAMLDGLAPPLSEKLRQKLQGEVWSSTHGSNVDSCGETVRYVTKEDYDRKKRKIHELAEQIATFQTAIAQEPSNFDVRVAALMKIKKALSLIEQHRESIGETDSFCWVCGGEGKEEHEEELVSALGTLAQTAAYVDRCVLAKSRCSVLEGDLAREVEVFKSLEIKGDSPSPSPQELLFKDDVACRSWKNAEAARKESAHLRAKADLLASAAAALSSAGKEMLAVEKTALESSVNSFLPEGDSFEVDLANARVGLVRDGEMHSALSGAEWNRVLLALACALESGSTLNVLAPGDRAWDRDTLERMMVALSQSDAQIIVMSTVKPEPVEGWTLIDLTRRENA